MLVIVGEKRDLKFSTAGLINFIDPQSIQDQTSHYVQKKIKQ